MIRSRRCTSFRMICAYRSSECAPPPARGEAILRANPPIAVRGFLISWAILAAISPSAMSFSLCTSRSCVVRTVSSALSSDS